MKAGGAARVWILALVLVLAVCALAVALAEGGAPTDGADGAGSESAGDSGAVDAASPPSDAVADEMTVGEEVGVPTEHISAEGRDETDGDASAPSPTSNEPDLESDAASTADSSASGASEGASHEEHHPQTGLGASDAAEQDEGRSQSVETASAGADSPSAAADDTPGAATNQRLTACDNQPREKAMWVLPGDVEVEYAKGNNSAVLVWLHERMWTDYPEYGVKRVRQVVEAHARRDREEGHAEVDMAVSFSAEADPSAGAGSGLFGSLSGSGSTGAGAAVRCLEIQFASDSTTDECARTDHGGCDLDARRTVCTKLGSLRETGFSCECPAGYEPTEELRACQAAARAAPRSRSFGIGTYARLRQCFAHASCRPRDACTSGEHECGAHSECVSGPEGTYACRCRAGFAPYTPTTSVDAPRFAEVNKHLVDRRGKVRGPRTRSFSSAHIVAGSVEAQAAEAVGLEFSNGVATTTLDCVDVDECAAGAEVACAVPSDRAGAPGSGAPLPGSSCVNEAGSFQCVCPAGTAADLNPVGGAFRGCVDVDECAHPDTAEAACYKGGTCVNLDVTRNQWDTFEAHDGTTTRAGFRCACPPVFTPTAAAGHGSDGCCIASPLALLPDRTDPAGSAQYEGVARHSYRVCTEADAAADPDRCQLANFLDHVELQVDIQDHADGFAFALGPGQRPVHLVGRKYPLHASFAYTVCQRGTSDGGAMEHLRKVAQVDDTYVVEPRNECASPFVPGTGPSAVATDGGVRPFFRHRCHERASCVDTDRGYECHCASGFRGNGFASAPPGWDTAVTTNFEPASVAGGGCVDATPPEVTARDPTQTFHLAAAPSSPLTTRIAAAIAEHHQASDASTVAVLAGDPTGQLLPLSALEPQSCARDPPQDLALGASSRVRSTAAAVDAACVSTWDAESASPAARLTVDTTLVAALGADGSLVPSDEAVASLVAFTYTAEDETGNVAAPLTRLLVVVDPCEQHATLALAPGASRRHPLLLCQCDASHGWSNGALPSSSSSVAVASTPSSSSPDSTSVGGSGDSADASSPLAARAGWGVSWGPVAAAPGSFWAVAGGEGEGPSLCHDVEPPRVEFVGVRAEGRESCMCESVEEVTRDPAGDRPENVAVWCSDDSDQSGPAHGYHRYCIHAWDNSGEVPQPVNFPVDGPPSPDMWTRQEGTLDTFLLSVSFQDGAGNVGSGSTSFRSGRTNVLAMLKTLKEGLQAEIDGRTREQRRWVMGLGAVVGVMALYGILANLNDIIDATALLVDPGALDSDYEAFRRGWDLLLWVRNPCARPSERLRAVDRWWNERDG